MPKLQCQTMTIRRTGRVQWHVHGDTHCGGKPALAKNGGKWLWVKYEIIFTCGTRVDERGFLLDQAAVDKWMRRIASKSTGLSCEMLARHVAEMAIEKIARDVPHCQLLDLQLTLSPEPHDAGITVRYGR